MRDDADAPEEVLELGLLRSEPVAIDRAVVRRALADFPGSHLTLYARTFLEDAVMWRLKAVLSDIAERELFVTLKVNPTMDAGAILYIGDECRIVLDARSKWIADIQRTVNEQREQGALGTPEEAFAYLREMLETTSPELEVEELRDTGSVLEVGDGVAVVSGLRDVGSQELVEFEGGIYGLAFSLLGDRVGCILLGAEEGIREGSDVERTGHLLKIPVGEALLGRIVNALGQPIDGRGAIVPKAFMPAERKAPGVVERQPVDQPLHTGITVIDALVPLGRGQRELIIGDRRIGKSTIALDTVLGQKGTGVRCVYACIGQKASTVVRTIQTLNQTGAMEYTAMVVALPDEAPAFRYLAPYAACAIGEYFMEGGGDSLVVYDDLSKHAATYREMSALLKRPVGREAYPGDIFYVHSRLLERAAHLSDERGAGSLTALPIVETLSSDISAFIPTNVISICDGQIVLDAPMFNEGIRPAMDVGLSVSRVGGSAQDRAIKQVAGRLRIDLAQYQEMAQFVKFGAEVDESTRRQLARGERARELLKQPQHTPLPMEHEALTLYAVTSGLLDDFPVESLARFTTKLFEHADVMHPDTMTSLRETRDLSPSVEGEIRTFVTAFRDDWLAKRTRGATGAGAAAGVAAEAGGEEPPPPAEGGPPVSTAEAPPEGGPAEAAAEAPAAAPEEELAAQQEAVS